jgi:hypothetical protein
MMMPPAVFSSALSGSTMTRSCNGRMFMTFSHKRKALEIKPLVGFAGRC